MTPNSSPVYTKQTLEELFNLRRGEIDLFVSSEGIPVFHPMTNAFVGYLPTLAAYFCLDARTYETCIGNVSLDNYKTSMSSTVVSIQAKSSHVPASSSLLHPEWIRLINPYMDLNEDTRILIPTSPTAPIFTGHARFIERLADDFPGGVAVIKTETIQSVRDKAGVV